jgi:hypothetical protein
MTHDYKRNGTTTLFAALNMLDGKVIGVCTPRHRAREFLRFLGQIDNQTPADLALHLIVDNYATHKTAAVNAGSRSTGAFISTSFLPRRRGSTWSSGFSPRSPKRGYAAVCLQASPSWKAPIMAYLDNHNADPKHVHLDKDRQPNLRKGGAGETSVSVTTLA